MGSIGVSPQAFFYFFRFLASAVRFLAATAARKSTGRAIHMYKGRLGEFSMYPTGGREHHRMVLGKAKEASQTDPTTTSTWDSVRASCSLPFGAPSLWLMGFFFGAKKKGRQQLTRRV